MIELHHIYVALMIGSAAVALVLGSLAFSYRHATRAAEPFAAMLAGEVIWSGAMALSWSVPTAAEQVAWQGIANLGSVVLSAGFLGFALVVAGRSDWRTLPRLFAVFAPPALLAVVGLLNPADLFYREIVGYSVGPTMIHVGRPGPLYWLFVIVLFAYVITGLILMMRVLLSSVGVRRTQAAIVFAGWAIPFIASITFVFGYRPLGQFDVTPVAFIITGVVWFMALLRGRLLDIAPLARDELVQHMDDGFIVVDARNRIVDTNRAAERLANVSAREVRGMDASAILGAFEGANGMLVGPEPWSGVAPVLVDGDVRYVDCDVRSLATGLGNPDAHLIMLHDVTELKRNEKRLEDLNRELEVSLRESGQLRARLREQATRDHLTGLHNRRYLDECLVREIARGGRSVLPVAVLMLDIDHFKQVNDTYSHSAGDAALRAVSRALLEDARAGDTVARFGGEEFVIVMPEAGKADAFQRAEEIRQRISETSVDLIEYVFSLTVSIGVAEFPSDGMTAEEIITACDSAMYRAKESGRNTTVAFGVDQNSFVLSAGRDQRQGVGENRSVPAARMNALPQQTSMFGPRPESSEESVKAQYSADTAGGPSVPTEPGSLGPICGNATSRPV